MPALLAGPLLARSLARSLARWLAGWLATCKRSENEWRQRQRLDPIYSLTRKNKIVSTAAESFVFNIGELENCPIPPSNFPSCCSDSIARLLFVRIVMSTQNASTWSETFGSSVQKSSFFAVLDRWMLFEGVCPSNYIE